MLLTSEETSIIFKKLLPLGKIPLINNDSTDLSFTETTTRRFIFDGWSVNKTGKSIKLTDNSKFNDRYLSFGLFESLSVLIQEDINLYKNLFNFFEQIEKYAASVVSSCSQSIIIFSHNSFGDRLFPHIHQDDLDKSTLSFFFNLTNLSNENPKLTLLDSLDKTSKAYTSGYTDHKLLLLHERKSKNTQSIEITNNSGILFNAAQIPHWLSYTEDLWVTVIYDNVTLIKDEFEHKDRHSVLSIKL
jgi:hypothetical protein